MRFLPELSRPDNSRLSATSVKSSFDAKFPVLVIVAPGCDVPYCNPGVTLIVSSGGAWGLVALKVLPLENLKLLAVVAENEPPISNRAFCPKIIPLGFIKNRLALLKLRINPSILEANPPVTLVMIFSISKALLKEAVPLVGTENSLKL